MHEKSNAVLTPHLNHPNCLLRKTQSKMQSRTPSSKKRKKIQITEFEKNAAKRWCERQAELITLMPSNAVLKPSRGRK